jgi:uncharacterized protein (TIGR03437 family)
MGGVLLLAAIAFADQSGCPGAPGCPPYYTAAGIANTAASVAGLYAPNTFVSIYGSNLSQATTALTGSALSIHLPGAEVTVLVGGLAADLWYASPGLVNILIPNQLTAGTVNLQLEVDGVAGPALPIVLTTVAPAMFQTDATTVLATHLNGRILAVD